MEGRGVSGGTGKTGGRGNCGQDVMYERRTKEKISLVLIVNNYLCDQFLVINNDKDVYPAITTTGKKQEFQKMTNSVTHKTIINLISHSMHETIMVSI